MAYDFSKVQVLIVESSKEMYVLFKSVMVMLSVPEKNIDSAFSHEEAFKKFCNKNHDIIITDWLQNPDHGIKLTKMIRTHKLSQNRYVPIIMTAGSGHYSRVIKARDAGISEYLVKPFAADALALRMTRVIEKRKDFVECDAFTGPDRRSKSVPFEGPEHRESQPKMEFDDSPHK